MPRRRTDEEMGGGSSEPATTSSSARSPAPRQLTDRQLEILMRVARGLTNRQAGQVLGISERTVRNHLRTIAKRLSTSDRTHAVVLAIGNGWIAIPIVPEPSADAARASGVNAQGKGLE